MYAQLYQYTQLEVTTYTVCYTLCASKISVNLLVQKLFVLTLMKWTPGVKFTNILKAVFHM